MHEKLKKHELKNDCMRRIIMIMIENIDQMSLKKLYESRKYKNTILDCDLIKNKEFYGFYIDFLKLAWKWTNIIYPKSLVWGNRMVQDFVDGLMRQIEPIVIKCLITEIHYCEKNGFLIGESSRDRYKYFNNIYIQSDKNLVAFFNAYPVLENLILKVIYRYCVNLVEIFLRIEKDCNLINSTIFDGVCLFKDVNSFSQLGDIHTDRKSVYCLRLNNGKMIIYKPRSIKYIAIFNSLLIKFCEKQNLKSKYIKILDMDEYGWIEYIVQKPCCNEQEIHEYYQRLGINLFLCYLMNIRDIHFENIIAHGKFPVLIDMEAFECERRDVLYNSADEKIEYFLRNSVLNVGILPFFIESKQGNGLNLSGIESKKQKSPYYVPVIVNSNTTDIKIEYFKPNIETAFNAPILNNKNIESGNYTEDIIKGFANAYVQAMEEKESLLKILRNEMKNVVCRYILKATQEYQILLNISYWPMLMTESKRRFKHILNMYDTKKDYISNKIKYSEILALLDGNIPYFSFKANSRGLYADNKYLIKNFFSNTLIEQIDKKVDALSEKDMKCQIKFITQTMALVKKSSLENLYTLKSILECNAEKYSKQYYLKAAVHLADVIVDMAIYGSDGSINWIVPRLHICNEMEWHLEPANMYMYSGLAGIAVFFHSVYHFTKIKRFEKIVHLLDEVMERYTKDVFENTKHAQSQFTGALNGEGSIVYAYQLIYELTGEKKYIALAKKHIQILKKLTKNCNCPDLISGNAGALLICLNMFKITGIKKYILYATEIAEDLIRNSQKQDIGGIAWKIKETNLPLSGFSHGNSGIVYALIKLLEEEKSQKYLEVIKEAITYEDLLYSDQINNWFDLRKDFNEKDKMDSVSWCHGAAGILISRLEVLKINYEEVLNDSIIDIDIKRAYDKIVNTPLRKGLCLCHGNFGNVEIMYKYIKYKKDKKLEKKLISYLTEAAEYIYYDKVKYLPQEENPSFMTGFSGIGYTLLRRIFDLPDILSIEI